MATKHICFTWYFSPKCCLIDHAVLQPVASLLVIGLTQNDRIERCSVVVFLLEHGGAKPAKMGNKPMIHIISSLQSIQLKSLTLGGAERGLAVHKLGS